MAWWIRKGFLEKILASELDWKRKCGDSGDWIQDNLVRGMFFHWKIGEDEVEGCIAHCGRARHQDEDGGFHP